MESPLKQRLIGAAVLAALAIIFLPMLLKGPDVREPDAAEVPLTMPAAPGTQFETRELPLSAPEAAAPAGGVLGMDSARPAPALPVADDTAVATDAAEDADAPPAEDSPPNAAAVVPKPVTEPAVPSPVAAASGSAAVAAGRYVVTIGTFTNLQNAQALASRLRAAQLPVKADRVELASGAALRIRVGPYADRAAAEAGRLRAEGITGSATRVVVLDADSAGAAAGTPTPSRPAAKPATPVAAAKPGAATPAAAPPASPAPATAAASPVSSGFAVQLSAPSVEAEALALRDRARGQGFSSFVQRVDTESGVRFRVRVGPVADRQAAVAMRDSVNGKLGTKGIVVTNP